MSKGPVNAGAPNEHKCMAEDCKKKPEKAQFCGEHFDWFKWGLITAQGVKARDFDKKYHGFLASKKAV